MKKTASLALIAGVTTIALAACSSPAANEEGDSRDVSVQLYNPPSTFSPLIPQVGGNELIQSLHWDSLLAVNDEGQLAPRLADSWEVSDDGLVWTFDLQDDLVWSDGEPFTADDVVFTFNLYANPASGSAVAGKLSTVEGFDDVPETGSASGFTAPDDDTFVMTLTAPNTANSAPRCATRAGTLLVHVAERGGLSSVSSMMRSTGRCGSAQTRRNARSARADGTCHPAEHSQR